MANEIDLVVGSAVTAQIATLMTELTEVDKKIQDIGKSAVKMNTALGVKDTASLSKLSAENAKLNKEIEKLTGSSTVLETKLANLASAQARETAAKEKATKATIEAQIAQEKLIAATNKNTTATEKKTKATLEETIAKRELNAQTTLNIKATTDAVGAYAKLDSQHKLAVKTAQDLAVATGRTGQAYEDAKNKANELGGRLRVIDTDIGKHTRNVGNYSSSWNGLGNSINQLTREAPAFANSVQTGFMALSNNIPILTDELGVLIQKNKDLQAEGKPTQSILKTVAGAFFSWQTAISLGVTILTVYGAKLVDLVFGLSEAEKKQKEWKDTVDEANSSVTSQTTQLKSLVSIVNDNNESEKNRKLAYDEIKKTLPGLESATHAQAIATGELTNATDLYILSLIQKNVVENESKIIADQQTALNKETKKGLDERMNFFDKTLLFFGVTTRKETEKQIKDLDKWQQGNINQQSKALIKSTEEYLKTQAKLAQYITPPKAEKAGKDKTEDVERKAIKSVNELQKVDTLLGRINTEIERLKVEKIVANAEELPAVNFQLEQLYTLKKQLNELPAVDLKIAIPSESVQQVKEMSKEMDAYLKSFSTEFASKAGFSETFNMLSGNIEGFGTDAKTTFVAVAESAQEMFNMIAQMSATNYEQEYARLDKQKETSLKFAGDSTVAKEKIEADYEKKKKEIQLKEFKQKQKITLANIAIDTAQAIVSTWAQVPKYDFGISATALTVMIGAMGAVQAGMVLAQKPPAYAEGTDNHTGGLMLVNDGAGSNFQEKVILPSGKVIRPQGRNVLMDAPKGTKVLNHEQQLFEMLQSNNISMPSQQSNGLTYDEMNEIFQKNLGNIKTQNTIFDKNGFQSYVKNGNSITRSNSNRSQAIGISV